MPDFETPPQETALAVADFNQITTRGDGTLEKHDQFAKTDIDFAPVLEHLKIHQDGEVAGSQFNGDLFKNSEELLAKIEELLPEQLDYDQFGRAEITLTLSGSSLPVGWSDIKSLTELQTAYPDLTVESRPHVAGGELAVVNGVQGAWYPEIDGSGIIKNTHGKFEPYAKIAKINFDAYEASMRTYKITIIIQKDEATQKPVVRTIFPGENAPAFPALIDTEDYKANSLLDSNESYFWNEHVFIEAEEPQAALEAPEEIKSLPERQQLALESSNEQLAEVRSTLEQL